MKQLTNSKLVRYVLIGGLSYTIEMGVLYALQTMDVGPLLAVTVSFWVGFAVAFLLQKFVAFNHRDTRRHVVAKQLVAYSALVAWNFVFTLLVVQWLSPFAPILVLRTAVILIVTIWNFAVYRILFREHDEGGTKEPDQR